MTTFNVGDKVESKYFKGKGIVTRPFTGKELLISLSVNNQPLTLNSALVSNITLVEAKPIVPKNAIVPKSDPLKYSKTSDSQDDRWYTPEHCIRAVRDVFGGTIELDPASALEPQAWIKAERIFTRADNGLAQEWKAKSVFLNPPGTLKGKRDPNTGFNKWYHKLVEEYEKGNTQEAIMIMFNVSSDTIVFHEILQKGFPICFARGRIAYVAPKDKYEKPKSQPRNATAFIYLGKNPEKFIQAFSKNKKYTKQKRPIGTVVKVC